MTNTKISSRRRFEADRIVSSRLRLMRNLLGRSQMNVAAALGLTFQQLQKYEKAGSRISAGRLQQIAVEYDCPVSWFFGDYDNSGTSPFTDEELEFVHLLRSCSNEGRQVVFKLLNAYRSPALLKQTNAALRERK